MIGAANGASRRTPRVSVVVITYCRPNFVRLNLEHLAQQTTAPHQVIVVDASPSDDTEAVVRGFSFATYLRHPGGAGNMTSSRNEALAHVSGDVLAFLDDDAYPAAGYLAALSDFFASRPEVALGCARTLNGVPGEEVLRGEGIGRLSADGHLLGNFAADPGRDVEIDHGIGATMCMRSTLVRELGGFREYYTGISGVREDADLFLRARACGHTAWFIHQAVALHVAAPQARGQRFDLRYRHWSSRNHTILLLANFGGRSAIFWRCMRSILAQTAAQSGGPHKKVGRTAVTAAGLGRGAWVSARTFGAGPQPPVGGYRQGGRAVTLPPREEE